MLDYLLSTFEVMEGNMKGILLRWKILSESDDLMEASNGGQGIQVRSFS